MMLPRAGAHLVRRLLGRVTLVAPHPASETHAVATDSVVAGRPFGDAVATMLIALMMTTAAAVVVHPQGGNRLAICHAGSVSAAFAVVEKEFARLHPSVTIDDVSGGSVALAARMAAGLQPCDVYAAADYLDIDLLLKPAGLADHTIVFARGRMVLAYLETDPLAKGIAGAGRFDPPGAFPPAASEWYRVLLRPGVRIAGSHPFLDPSGYRAHMMFQLAQAVYGVPNLANALVDRYTVLSTAGSADAAGRTLGTDFTFQIIYEHSAAAAAKGNPAYRYVSLPERIDLSTSREADFYRRAAVPMPGLGTPGSPTPVSIPAARVAWGLTIPTASANREQAAAFVGLLLGAVGTGALAANGPPPIAPALISTADYARLPPSLRSLVRQGDVRP